MHGSFARDIEVTGMVVEPTCPPLILERQRLSGMIATDERRGRTESGSQA